MKNKAKIDQIFQKPWKFIKFKKFTKKILKILKNHKFMKKSWIFGKIMEIQKVQEKKIRIFEKWQESSKFRKVQRKHKKNYKTKKLS